MSSLRLSVLALVVTVLFMAASLPAGAQASKRASSSESARMWNAVERTGQECQRHRARISTARTARRYGLVTISDRRCGNGQVVLRKARGGRWVTLGSGSDWGYPDRCASDRKRIPASVLRDFFPRASCYE